jgi:tetratricopeptide (TPR) repeat protein
MSFSEKEILSKVEVARKNYAAKKFNEAITLYEELSDILKDDSDNLPVIQIELGWSYYNQQDYPKAISLLKKALKSKTLSEQQAFDCTRLIGFSKELQGRRKEAIQFLNNALDIDVPDNLKRFTYFELGKIYFLDGQIIEAEQYLKMAADLFSEQEMNYKLALAYYQGFTAYFLKKFKESNDQFDFIIKNADDYKTKASGYFGLAHLHYHRKEYSVLIDLCEKIIRLDESFFDKETLGFFLCESHYYLNNWTKLENLSKELVQQYPTGRYAGEYEKYQYAGKHHKLAPSKSKVKSS